MPKRPRDSNSLAHAIVAIASGQADDPVSVAKKHPGKGVAGGKQGGPARAKSLSPERRTEIAQKAAKARWDKT